MMPDACQTETETQDGCQMHAHKYTLIVAAIERVAHCRGGIKGSGGGRGQAAGIALCDGPGKVEQRVLLLRFVGPSA